MTSSPPATAEVATPGPRLVLARVLTEALSPIFLVVGLLMAVGWDADRANGWRGIGWGLLAALFAGILPYGIVMRWVRTGRVSDRHIRVREQRRVPLILGCASVIVGLVVLGWLGAPRVLIALVLAMLVGLATTLAVTIFWKVSVHSAVAAGTAVILLAVFGPLAALVSVPLTFAVGWSRVQLRDHTSAQVLAGFALGAAAAGIIFSLAR